MYAFGHRRSQRLAIAALSSLIVFGTGIAAVNLWAEYHFRAARTEIDRNRLPAAMEHLNRCLKVGPSSFRVNFLAARTARRLGDIDAAERHLQRCQQQSGANLEAIFLERLMLRAQQGDVDVVERALRDQVQKGHPDSVLILESLARGYAVLFRLADLDFVLHHWQERDPDSLLATFFEGWLKEQRGPRAEAVEAYRTVVERDPDNAEARIRLANLLLERAQPQEALTHLMAVAPQQRDNLAIKVRIARTLHDLGRLDEAAAELGDILRREPNYQPALLARGRLALQNDQVPEAEAWLRKAAELDKSDYQAVYLLHQSLERQDKQAEAATMLGRMKGLEADIRKMQDILTLGISERPDDPELYVQAARILLRSGQAPEALRWLQQALKRDPAYPRAHEALADHFESIGDMRRAQHHRQVAGWPAPSAAAPK